MSEHYNQGVGAIRVSTTKQYIEGDSPEDQKKAILYLAVKLGIKINKWFVFAQSGSGEVQPSQEAIDFCKDPNNHIEYFLITRIDRFTRAGAGLYISLKEQLTKYKVQLLDAAGVISSEVKNTLAHLGVSFSWSNYSPSFRDEILEAEEAKSDLRKILTRLIGAEVNYARLGYMIGPAKMGYQNVKIETIQHGERTIYAPHPIESKWFIRMYELRVQGDLSDEEIVNEINLLGFRSRQTKIHDMQDRGRVLGYREGKKLNAKQLLDYVSNPIYAGVFIHKWTDNKPILGQFEGLVSIDLFNKANRGKISIVRNGASVSIVHGPIPMWQQKKLHDNPLFPFKDYVLCPICRKHLIGSAPKGKAGKRYAGYDCNRGHYFRVPLAKFDEEITKFVKEIHFDDEFKRKFKVTVLEELIGRGNRATNDSVDFDKRLIQIDEEIGSLKRKIRLLSLPETIKMFEEDIVGLQNEKMMLVQKRDNKEVEQKRTEERVNKTEYYIEHLHELILGGDDKAKNAAFFGLLFDEVPTWNDIINRTPKLACIFKLNDDFISQKNLQYARRDSNPQPNA